MRILLLSAYDTLSHRHWRESLVVQFPEFEWTTLYLAPRFFNFRVRSNPLSWIDQYSDQLQQAYDLVVATSLVDMSTLRGLVPALAQTPLWLYCHENQFAYPSSSTQQARGALKHDLDVKMVFLYNCLCADTISFNSGWNRHTALQGLEQLIKAFPEKFDNQILEKVRKKSDVLAVPLNCLSADTKANNQSLGGESALRIVWNHRWEYDKGPEYLLAFVKALSKRKLPKRILPIVLDIVGQQFRQRPEAFARLQQFFDGENSTVKLDNFGFIESRETYLKCLQEADIVLSTALHDFQGLSMLEAVQLGCVPLLPDRLAYPEYFDERFLYKWDDEPEACANFAVDQLVSLIEHRSISRPPLTNLEWPALRMAYKEKLLAFTSYQSGA